MNLELLNQIEEAYRTGEILELRVDGVLDTKLVKDIHGLYISGHLHLPKYYQVFGYSKAKNLKEVFKRLGLKILTMKQTHEIYRTDIQSGKKKTNLERYGVENPGQDPAVREKVKKTNLERYGVENPGQDPAVREKVKKTNLERYGSASPFGSPEIRMKIRETFKRNFGYDNPFQSPDIQDRIKQTNLERYGSVSPLGSLEVRKKIVQTNLERYGSVSPFGSPEIITKSKMTCKANFGYENPLQSPEIIARVKQTNLNRYGYVSPLGSPEIWNKIKTTNLERYGVKIPTQSPIIQEKMKQTRKSNDWRIARMEYLVENEPDKVSAFVMSNFSKGNHAAILRRYGLYQENLSTPEAAIREILEKHKIEYQLKYRPKFMDGKELDFFIPNKNLAIEVNGLYWHSYPKKDKYYHQNKHLRCRSEGIQLLSFTEDQILEKSGIIESMILHKLGKTPYRVYAKKCDIVKIDHKKAKDFLENNHLHGFSNASVYLGLEYNGKLVHLMSFGNNRFKKSEYPELIRSASLRFHSIAGGFQRLLKYYKRSHGVDLVESYVDFNISNGQSYELASNDLGDLGVGPVRETPRDNLTEPDLWFVFRGKRYPRQMFMKHNLYKIFKDFPRRGDQGYENITVREFLENRQVLEYYGAGNLKYLI